MWRNWSWNPVINPAQSEDSFESVESSADPDPDELVSPRRPPQSPSVSPRALLVPEPPPVEEVLAGVDRQLRAQNRDRVRALQEAAAAGANMPEPAIVPFQDEDGVDENGALREACARVEKVAWDENDLHFTFTQIETKMASSGVKKQFTKFQVLTEALPKVVINECKDLLRRNEAEFPDKNAYKLLKQKVLRVFGPKQEDAVDRALGRVMAGKPSQLARALVDDICQNNFDCKCCHAVVSSLWKRHLPSNVRAGIAGIVLSKDNFENVVKQADDIHASSTPAGPIAAVTVAAVSSGVAPAGVGTNPSLNETQPALQYPVAQEVNAIGRGRGGRGRGNRGYRGNRGGNRNNRGGQQSGGASGGGGQNRFSGTKHPDLPDGEWRGCSMHFRWGRSAFFLFGTRYLSVERHLYSQTKMRQ